MEEPLYKKAYALNFYCRAKNTQGRSQYVERHEKVHGSFPADGVWESEEQKTWGKPEEVHRAEEVDGGLWHAGHPQLSVPVV